MIKFLLLAAVALATPAMAQETRQNVARDSYVFEKAEYVKPTFTVNLVVHETRGDFVAAFKARWKDRKADQRIQAYSILRKDVCEIHIVNPKVQYKPEYLGHEIMHCAMGRWHDVGNY